MPLKCICPRCGKVHRKIDRSLLGKKFVCSCGKVMRLGRGGESSAVSTAQNISDHGKADSGVTRRQAAGQPLTTGSVPEGRSKAPIGREFEEVEELLELHEASGGQPGLSPGDDLEDVLAFTDAEVAGITAGTPPKTPAGRQWKRRLKRWFKPGQRESR
jgi:hypothetical protein